jgi:hypothetical protein
LGKGALNDLFCGDPARRTYFGMKGENGAHHGDLPGWNLWEKRGMMVRKICRTNSSGEVDSYGDGRIDFWVIMP